MTPQQKASWDALVKQLKRNRKKRNRPYYNAIRLSIRILWSLKRFWATLIIIVFVSSCTVNKCHTYDSNYKHKTYVRR